jgi:hypothetical protein
MKRMDLDTCDCVASDRWHANDFLLDPAMCDRTLREEWPDGRATRSVGKRRASIAVLRLR